MCELLHTSAVVQKMQGALSFWANRSSLLIGELLLGKLSETVVVQGNAPHDRPGFLVGHLIGNRASFLCTKAPMLRVPETNFHSTRASAQVTAPGAITSRIVAVSTRPNRQNRSACSRMSVPLVQNQKLRLVNRINWRVRRSHLPRHDR